MMENTVNRMVQEVLKKYFSRGFMLNSPIETGRFRRFFLEETGQECPVGNENLENVIKENGFAYGGKVYVLSGHVQNRLLETIKNHMKDGCILFYYRKLYEKNEDWLYEERIFEPEMLREVLKKLFPEGKHKPGFFITMEKSISEIEALRREIHRVWDDRVLMDVSTLAARLPFIPAQKIRVGLVYNECFVWNSFETYTKQESFVFSVKDKEKILDKAEKLCQENGKVDFEELEIEEIREENFELSESAFYKCLYFFLKDRFERNHNVLYKKGVECDTYHMLYKYCVGRESCTLEELDEYTEEISGKTDRSLELRAGNSAMIRINRDTFVAEDRVNFDIDTLDKILDESIHSDGIAIRQITAFAAFPYCGFPWNWFLLESYCRRFSKKFEYKALSPNSRNGGAIVRRSSKLDYHQLMAKAVAESPIGLDKDSVYEYLVETGYMIRQRYSKIDDLIEKAKVLRQRRE